MADGEPVHSPGDSTAPADGGFMSGKGLAGGVGAVVGGLATLAATLGVKDLLQNNPFFALALFALLAAILIFGIALMGTASTSRLWPVAGFALALLCFGVATGLVAMIKGPAKVEFVIQARPSLNDAKPIRFGADDVSWATPTHIRAAGGGQLTLDLTSLQDYYANKESKGENAIWDKCFDAIEHYAKVGAGAPKTPAAPPGA